MSFARPDLLWLAAALPLVVAVAVVFYARRRRRVARALGGSAMALRLGAGDLDRFPAGRLALLALAATAVGLAAARPQWGYAAATGHVRALSLVLTLDASNSMRVGDVAPDRLERERLLAERVLRELGGDRIGLIGFAGQAYVLSPLTVDHSALQLYVDALDPDILSAGGTALSSALRQATDLIATDQAAGDQAVVLVSDGEALEDEDAVIQAAERAKAAGVIVHTVGVGTPAGGRVPEIDPGTGRVAGWAHDVDGSVVVSKLNEPLLRRIARITGGTYIHLGEAGATERLLSVLRSMRRGVTDAAGNRIELQDRSAWFVGVALLLLALDALADRRARRARASAPPAAARAAEA